ncbi:MAG: glycosyltransferase family 39 protein [Terracidiphilus sp.]
MSRSNKLTLLAVVAYLLVMFATNGVFTILDDESAIVTIAGHPVIPTLNLFLFGAGQHEHPPLGDILLHAWLVATGFSFAMLRVFANLFYAASIVLTAKSAQEIGGPRSYWVTLGLGLVWPFAYQYGRITGWYCVFLFFISLTTRIYLRVVRDGRNHGLWLALVLAGILAVWTNYFAVAVLLILFVDMILFHRRWAAQNAWKLAACGIAIAISFLPLLRIALLSLPPMPFQGTQHFEIRSLIAVVGYPVFALFGSAAVAPWYWLLSLPIALSAILLLVSVWLSPGRKWLLYSAVPMVLLTLSGHMNIKRILFLLGWLFLAFGLAAASSAPRVSRYATGAVTALVVLGWVGIFSGKHYSTTNLYEPWRQVADTVARDIRQDNAAVVSDNEPFFFYLNYQLGLQAETAQATAVNLAPEVYAARGYRVFAAHDMSWPSDLLHGNVILVTGPGVEPDLEVMSNLRNLAGQKCRMTRAFQAAPDPALALKEAFVPSAGALAYRVDVDWYQCPARGDDSPPPR